jgi:hypothetical protein
MTGLICNDDITMINHIKSGKRATKTNNESNNPGNNWAAKGGLSSKHKYGRLNMLELMSIRFGPQSMSQ